MRINKRILLRIYERVLRLLHRPFMDVRVKRLRCEGMQVGDYCKIFTDLTLSEPYLVTIGDNVTISTNCTLLTHDNSVIKFIANSTDVMGKIVIGNNCFIGASAIILPGVSLANGTVVGAGSVVTKSIINPHCVIAGNPAKVISSTDILEEKYLNGGVLFNLSGMDKEMRKREILNHPNRLISRQ